MSSCGVANWGGPKPGDPNNNSVLQAKSAIGGIEVSWTMPTVNSFAVAYTLLYRSTDANFANAIEIATWSGNQYFDRVYPGIEYWYWIRIVSVNGTENTLIGPASAHAYDSIENLIQELTGRIDQGVLAIALRERIDSITLLEGGLLQEVQDRFGANSALAAAVQALQSDVNEIFTVFAQEIVQRTTGDSALVDSMSLMGVKVDNNRAAIIQEATVRADRDSALAQRIDTIEATGGDSGELIAQAEERMQVKIDAVKDTAESLYSVKLTANNLIGGFGVYNNSEYVEAAFDVDIFWIGRTNANKVKPFIIQGDTVYMNRAMIGTAYIDTLMIGLNQVTIPIGAYTAAEQSYLRPADPQGAPDPVLYLEYEIQSAWINSTGAPISIAASSIFKTGYSSDNASVQVRRNGVILYEYFLQLYTNSFCTVLMDTPGVGTHNYQIVLRLGVIHPEYAEPGQRFAFSALNRAIQLMELKR